MEKTIQLTHDKVTKNYFRYVAPQGAEVTGTIFIRKDQITGQPPAAIVVVVKY